MLHKSNTNKKGKKEAKEACAMKPKISEILIEDFMKPYGLTVYKLARDIDLPVSRVQGILRDTHKITVDTSVRLGKYFGLSDKYFLDLQNDIDIKNLKEKYEAALARVKVLG